MSSKPEQKGPEEKKGGVNLGDLPRREEELTDEEARQIKGVGGARGGVSARNEETLQQPH